MHKLLFFLFTLTSYTIYPQSEISNFGRLLKFELHNAPFPHSDRDNGHIYNDKLYSAKEHYKDSTALVFIPKYFEPKGVTDCFVYFHGWNNNVDSMIVRFNLIEQFYKSGINAILIMPEGPKNSPDSFGGKLEERNMFSKFVSEVFDKTSSKMKLNLLPGNISLAGHSGGYRVMAYILLRGGLSEKISKVIIFDGLYADVEKYSNWLDHYNGKFINIYTQNGGTKRESENLMECLSSWDIPYIYVVEDSLSETVLNNNRIIFIESQLSHGGVIHERNQFEIFISAN